MKAIMRQRNYIKNFFKKEINLKKGEHEKMGNSQKKSNPLVEQKNNKTILVLDSLGITLILEK